MAKQWPDWSESNRGLDLSAPDLTTVEEWEALRESDVRHRGAPLPSYELMGALGRPDAVKRWFLQIRQFTTAGSYQSPLTWVHLYLIWGFEHGVMYEIRNCEIRDLPRSHVVDTVVLAFLHSPAQGMNEMAGRVGERLQTYKEPTTPAVYPEGWEHDPEAFESGLDFSQPDMSPDELKLLEDWYLRTTGEVPESVRFLGEFRPNLLKAYRDRFENAARALPKQMVAWLTLNWEVVRGHEAGIREAVLLCKGFGMTRQQTVDAIAWAMLYGAPGAMGNAYRAAGDVLRDWDAEK